MSGSEDDALRRFKEDFGLGEPAALRLEQMLLPLGGVDVVQRADKAGNLQHLQASHPVKVMLELAKAVAAGPPRPELASRLRLLEALHVEDIDAATQPTFAALDAALAQVAAELESKGSEAKVQGTAGRFVCEEDPSYADQLNAVANDLELLDRSLEPLRSLGRNERWRVWFRAPRLQQEAALLLARLRKAKLGSVRTVVWHSPQSIKNQLQTLMLERARPHGGLSALLARSSDDPDPVVSCARDWDILSKRSTTDKKQAAGWITDGPPLYVRLLVSGTAGDREKAAHQLKAAVRSRLQQNDELAALHDPPHKRAEVDRDAAKDWLNLDASAEGFFEAGKSLEARLRASTPHLALLAGLELGRGPAIFQAVLDQVEDDDLEPACHRVNGTLRSLQAASLSGPEQLIHGRALLQALERFEAVSKAWTKGFGRAVFKKAKQKKGAVEQAANWCAVLQSTLQTARKL